MGVDNLLQNKSGKIKSSYVPKNGNSTKYVSGDILIGNIRPYLKKIWLADNIGGTNGDVLTIHIIDQRIVLPKYLFYILSSDEFFEYDTNNSKGAKMPRGDKSAVMKYNLILPTLEYQFKTIEVLDKFYNLITNIQNGLPAEIEARQKQYEFYRDKLLSFEEI